ncbi:DUF397 domain-containing protein [Actinomadura atramentaria]|uniref:DUF397 domain-containing protein n=1 Tax=Actinomadura atramentaria TaxID=1990 RepID=UPI000376FF28|nr:DUF397 domain-containing protein [Actinomadura atramentaria]
MTDFTTATWRKSTRSNTRQECVEVATAHPTWRKSTRSNANRECVEVADTSPTIAVRDSKSPRTGHLPLTRSSFAALLTQAKSGTLDL